MYVKEIYKPHNAYSCSQAKYKPFIEKRRETIVLYSSSLNGVAAHK
jgi:hypothetical protein